MPARDPRAEVIVALRQTAARAAQRWPLDHRGDGAVAGEAGKKTGGRGVALWCVRADAGEVSGGNKDASGLAAEAETEARLAQGTEIAAAIGPINTRFSCRDNF